MAGPYRESDTSSIDCPRCGRAMPAGEIAACIRGCGVWVNAETARTAFMPAELEESRLTSWHRVRAVCPHCAKEMTLRGYDMSLFLGCDSHGFWVDAETIGQTGLARAAIAPQVQRARDAAKAVKLEEEKRAQAEREARQIAELERQKQESSLEYQRAKLDEETRARQALAMRVAKRQPYVALLQAMMREGQLAPLADYLLQLDETIHELRDRVNRLEFDLRR